MSLTKRVAGPVTRWGWHVYYADKYVRFKQEQALHLATWYQLLYLAFGDKDE